MNRPLLKAERGFRTLAVCAVLVAPMSVLSTASAGERPPRIIAIHQWFETTDNGDGTYGVVFEVSFTNAGAAAIDDLRVELIDAGVAPVLPGENVLAVGSLTPGQTTATSWRIITYAPMEAGMAARPLFIHGEAVDEGGFPIGVGILSRGRPVP
jgi:hypothetical protein